MTAAATFDASALPFRAMPEPPRFGLAGHLPEWLGVENARGVLGRLLRYAEQCGPVARVSLGPVRMVVISDPDIAAEVLADPRANHKGAVYSLTRVVLDNVLLLNGTAWETHRRIYRQALRGVDAVGSAAVVSRRFADELAGAGDAPIRLEREVFRFVADVVGHFVAGVQIPTELEPHRQRIQHELAAVGIDLQCQPWTYLSPMRWIRLRRSVTAVRGFFREAVRRRLGEPGARPDVLGGFLALARAGEYPGDVDSLQGGVVNFFFTAHDVLSSSAAWILYLLAQHPEVQAELRASLPGDGDLLRRIIKEGLRLYPGYSLFGRTTRAPMTIGGYVVPRGTMLIASPYVTHRLARHWPAPQEFDPGRWSGRGTGTPPPAARDHYMPFGTGARACLASHLAFPVLETIVAEVVARVELRAVPGHDPGLSYWGTAYPRNGMPVHVRPVAPA